MLLKLANRFDALELQKRNIVADMASLPAEQLSFKPKQEQWSILEVLDHLVKVEESMATAVRRALPTSSAVSFIDWTRAFAVILVMKSPMRVKVPPTSSKVLPTATESLPQTVTRWSNAREVLLDLSESISPGRLKDGFFRHPVSGWMTMEQALSFLSAHIQHHVYQLNRLKVSGSSNLAFRQSSG